MPWNTPFERSRTHSAFWISIPGVITSKSRERLIPAIFNNYYKHLGIKNEMSKADFHSLVEYNDALHIDFEVTEVLDRLLEVTRRAKPAR